MSSIVTLPRPFARVLIGYGEPVEVPPALDAEAVEEWRSRLEEALRECTERLALEAGEGA